MKFKVIPEINLRNFYYVQLAINVTQWIFGLSIYYLLSQFISNALVVIIPLVIMFLIAIWGSRLRCPRCHASFMWYAKSWQPRRKCPVCKWPANSDQLAEQESG